MRRSRRAKLSVSIDGHDASVRCCTHNVDPLARLKVYAVCIPLNMLLPKTKNEGPSIVHRFSVLQGVKNIVRAHSPLAHSVHGVLGHGVHPIHGGPLGTTNLESTGAHLMERLVNENTFSSPSSSCESHTVAPELLTYIVYIHVFNHFKWNNLSGLFNALAHFSAPTAKDPS